MKKTIMIVLLGLFVLISSVTVYATQPISTISFNNETKECGYVSSEGTENFISPISFTDFGFVDYLTLKLEMRKKGYSINKNESHPFVTKDLSRIESSIERVESRLDSIETLESMGEREQLKESIDRAEDSIENELNKIGMWKEYQKWKELEGSSVVLEKYVCESLGYKYMEAPSVNEKSNTEILIDFLIKGLIIAVLIACGFIIRNNFLESKKEKE